MRCCVSWWISRVWNDSCREDESLGWVRRMSHLRWLGCIWVAVVSTTASAEFLPEFRPFLTFASCFLNKKLICHFRFIWVELEVDRKLTSTHGSSSRSGPGQSWSFVSHSGWSPQSHILDRARVWSPQSPLQSDQLHHGVQLHVGSGAHSVCSSSGHSRDSSVGTGHSVPAGQSHVRTRVCCPGPHSESQSDQPHHSPISHSIILYF